MLISEDYRRQQQRMHAAGGYGVMGGAMAHIVAEMVERTGVRELLDYGCGTGSLWAPLRELVPGIVIHGYDPAVAAHAAMPEPCDLVVCLDVLEHIEPECLDDVLADLARVTLRDGLLTIHTGPAVKTLPDGRNAHLIQRPAAWWLSRVSRHLEPVRVERLHGQGVLMEVRGLGSPAP